ncbi:MAG: hypothetical protein ABIG44_12905 [Planctomycetota bacterium]
MIAVALAWPTCGPQWVSDQLAREGVMVAPVTIWRLLRRSGLGTRRARLAVLEQHSATTTGLLTERTSRVLRRPVRHVEAAQPGDLLSLDTFYVGKLKGVGRVWQLTGCDVASSFGWARIVAGEVTAAAGLRFLREVVRPAYRQAGWRLARVLTDNGLPQKSRRQSFSDLTMTSVDSDVRRQAVSTVAELHADHSHTGSGDERPALTRLNKALHSRWKVRALSTRSHAPRRPLAKGSSRLVSSLPGSGDSHCRW